MKRWMKTGLLTLMAFTFSTGIALAGNGQGGGKGGGTQDRKRNGSCTSYNLQDQGAPSTGIVLAGNGKGQGGGKGGGTQDRKRDGSCQG